ncbi:MAG TPA: hypothetical protein VM573_01550 [Actinomycetota bacterium]|jgi:hypothetical protein|nr:hypothetical protein [Actinomycetota bacterium]
MRAHKLIGATLAAMLAVGGIALAKFEPKFDLKLSDLKRGGNPQADIHLEFAADDEEIGAFKMTLPKGTNVASDEDIPDAAGPIPTRSEGSGEEIGGGTVVIRVGPDCRPGPEGALPIGTEVTLDATIYERPRTDAEADEGVHAVWFLDLEPANRVRLLVKGSPQTGWTVEGAPTPSDNTCNPLTVDLTINAKSESGVPIITNPTKGKKMVITAEIVSQDSPAVATFKKVFKLSK